MRFILKEKKLVDTKKFNRILTIENHYCPEFSRGEATVILKKQSIKSWKHCLSRQLHRLVSRSALNLNKDEFLSLLYKNA